MALLSELESLLADMSPEQIAEVDKLIEPELSKAWLPNPGPQTQALESKADILLYGGAAGGGKSDLLIGCAQQDHKRALIIRRESTELDGIIARSKEILSGLGDYNKVEKEWALKGGQSLKLGGMKDAEDWRAYAGRARDYLGFDEAAEFLKDQVFSLIAWLRSTDEGQRCRVILASNPPRGGEGEWVIEEFKPWLDPLYPKPAAPGELRWAIRVNGDTEWVDGPGVYQRGGEDYTAMSRTFIPARLDDNPYLSGTNYRATLQNLPEPLRSQLLKGDFLAGRKDHEWQVIPSAWVDLANQRWERAPEKTRKMLALSSDVAAGGDSTEIARLHEEAWFAPMVAVEPALCTEPLNIALEMIKLRRDGADLSLDMTGGWGSGVRSHLLNTHKMECHGFVYSEMSNAVAEESSLGFMNCRAELWWRFREALDPKNGHDVKLPPDARLKAELTAPRYKVKGTKILIESKDEIKKRIGGSTDKADAVVQAWDRRMYGGRQPAEAYPTYGGRGSWLA